jgi:hypothetical protein
LEETIPARTTLPALGRIACVLRPGSVSGADLALRSFAAFPAERRTLTKPGGSLPQWASAIPA